MKRTEARELAMQTIYSRFFNPNGGDDINELFKNADAKGLEFTSNVLHNFAEHYEEINEMIETHLKGYTLDRLNKIDFAIVILAIIELKFIKETPKEVVINEAVELAKKYSTEKSPKFINGLLADIIKE